MPIIYLSGAVRPELPAHGIGYMLTPRHSMIYLLTDPRDGGIRYVGITKRVLSTRLSAHLSAARLGEQTHRAAWLRVLMGLGLRPRIIPLEDTDDRLRECFWIAALREAGNDLVNTTTGGDGSLGFSAETRARIRAAGLGRKPTAAALAAQSEGIKRSWQSGLRKPPERKRGYTLGPYSPERRAKMGRPPRTHCTRGHEYAGDNLVLRRGGAERSCRACERLRGQAVKARKRG